MDFLVDLYLKEMEKIRERETVRVKGHRLKHLTDYTDSPIDFNRSEIVRFYEYLTQKGLKERTIRLILDEVALFYEWLKERGYSVFFDRPAVSYIYRSKRRQTELRKKKRYFSDEDIEVLLSAVRGTLEGFRPKHPIYYLLIVFLTCSGLRISEALRVKKKDVKIKKVLTKEGEEKEVWFVRVKEGKFGKEREALIYFFREEWKPILKKWLSHLKDDDFIFTYTLKYPKKVKTLTLKQNTTQRFFWELEKELKEKGYEMEVNAHKFRNTYITKLATLGFPVNLVAEWVGHERISTTMDVYMQAEKEKALEVVIEKL